MNIYCPDCEAANREDAELCSMCGHRLKTGPKPPPPSGVAQVAKEARASSPPNGHNGGVDKTVIDAQIHNLGDFDRWFTRKERNYLHQVMTPGETIHAMTSGLLDGNTWLVTVTDKRVLFLDKGMLYGLKQMELPLDHISAIAHSTGMMFGKIEVSTAGGTKLISMIEKADVPKVASILSDLVEAACDRSTRFTAEDGSTQLVSQLERLAVLKQKGVISEQEFQNAKAKLLSE